MHLSMLEKHQLDNLKAYTLSEQSLLFTKHPYERAKLSYNNSFMHCIVALEEENIVGFLALDKGEDLLQYCKDPHTILLRSLSVDERYQGMGYGKKMMHALPCFIKKYFPTINSIVFGVNKTNTYGIRFYESLGFKYTQKKRVGRSSDEWVMFKNI